MREYTFLHKSMGHVVTVNVPTGTDMSGIITEFGLIGYNLV